MKDKLDTQFIEYLKKNPDKLSAFLRTESNNGRRVVVLERLGHLDKSFNRQPFLNLMSDPNDQIRYLTVKNLAKLEDLSLLDTFYYIAKHDPASMVRREAVSGIGRLRSKTATKYLVELLEDQDPKVVLQAIRGLLVFKNDPQIIEEIKKKKDHPNETIRFFIKTELFPSKTNNHRNHCSVNLSLRNVVVHGDVLETLKHVPEESIHLTFTSPPYYNARDYSIYSSYSEYLAFLEKVFSEVYRVTKEGRFFVLNTSPIIIPRISRSYSSKRYPIPYDLHPLLVKMGWEFLDDIVWVKPESSVKNRIAGFLQHRKPLAYKPNAVTEMLMVYRKSTDKLLDWNIHQYDLDVVEKSKVSEPFESTNVWKVDPIYDKNHSAVFPISLCDRVIKYYSMVGDLVFDPFAGSGTLGKSALRLNRNFFLTEIEAKYVEYMRVEFGTSGFTIDNSRKVHILELSEFIKGMEK